MVTPNTRVCDIKDMIRLETGVTVKQQLLVFNGKEMLDQCCMSDNGIHSAVTVWPIIRPRLLQRGGMDKSSFDTTSAFLEEVVNLDAMRNENALWRRMQAALPDMLSDLETVELTAVLSILFRGS